MRPVAIVLCLLAGLWFGHKQLLGAAGSLFVNEERPVKSDVIAVLGGDGAGYRILKGAELAREGFAPVVIVSNSGLTYGHTEAELETDFAVHHGYAPNLFVTETWESGSTLEEAGRIIAELRRRGNRRALIVTTVWHTARAGRVFRRLAPELEFHIVGSEDPHWHNGDWWTDRDGRKLWLMEAIKTTADWLRL